MQHLPEQNEGNNRRQHRQNAGNNGRRGRHAGNERRGANNFQRQNLQFNRTVEEPSDYPKTASLKKIEDIANSDTDIIFSKLSDKQNSFKNLLESSNVRADFFPLILKITSKVAQSHFDQLKLKLILDICNSNFIVQLEKYLSSLPYTMDKAKNSLYWQNQDEFWKNFVAFCECIVTLSPSTASKHCLPLIEAISRCCLEGLKNRHAFEESETYNTKLLNIRDKLVAQIEGKQKQEERVRRPLTYEEGPPPENFRELSILPTRNDLVLDCKPYLRPNIVNGAYENVEHYLDVQFRLLREDCFEPLRKGIRDYMQNPDKKRYENIRIYHGVKIAEPYISNAKCGSIIQVGEKDTKRFANIKWEYNKRFIFGSLLLLTKADFKCILTSVILDRDPKLLAQGKIPVSLLENSAEDVNLYKDDVFTMVESEVYFEPYLHVLRALQDPLLPEKLPLQRYIVHLNVQPQHPSYLTAETEYSVNGQRFKVLGQEWPESSQLRMNDSQGAAFRLALTHECALIQGPPGTGKTYVGVRLAKTLLKNLNRPGPLILLICYTNHALDQFLKEVMKIEPNVARVGGQSRDKDMENVNLVTLRKGFNDHLLRENKLTLENDVRKLQKIQNVVHSLDSSILSYNCLAQFPEAAIVGQQFQGRGDPIVKWLLHTAPNYVKTLDPLELEDEIAENTDTERNKNIFRRHKVSLDDFDDHDVDSESSLGFSVEKAKKDIRCYLKLREQMDPTQILQLDLKIHRRRCQIQLFKNEKARKPKRDKNTVINNQTNVFKINMHQRWALYFEWEKAWVQENLLKMRTLKETLERSQGAYEEARILVDAKALKSKRVIGMTTSGAARLKKLLMSLGTPIVIVEEAAEVLEQHIISSLTSQCEHLILIGDHQQLRPSASSMQLAKHYNIEVSLFERLVMNQIHSKRLSVQHRMRPELAQLISPHIYPELRNHPSVAMFPNVRGITSNLFFFTHDYKETKVDDSTSRCNEEEADMVLSLANYIMQQGYDPEDVTILAAYAGQLFYMSRQRVNYRFLSKVKITVVDNYQGEESKIILLSLVRNNEENKIGFLGTDNRVCVALSRAREGFYLFGNITILKSNSELWAAIAGTLEENNKLGSSLVLRCENHSTITEVSTPKHFNNVPEGGCMLKCNYDLPCGHQCPLVCHGYDRNHKDFKCTFKCTFKCSRILCQFDHECPLTCGVFCTPCVVTVDKTFTKCGHVNKVPCFKFDTAEKCFTTVKKTLPCDHEGDAACHMDPEDVICLVKCEARLACGHRCRRNCHVRDDPTHERYKCQAKCARAKAGCTAMLEGDLGSHQCNLSCYQACDPCTVEVVKRRSDCTHKSKVPCNQDVNMTNCIKKCVRALPCGHFCQKKCFEKCGGCKQKMTKTIPECQHVVVTTCDTEVTRSNCTRKCERRLPCGHPCPGYCSQECDPTTCNAILETVTYESPCGHKVNLPCNVHEKVKGDESLLREALLQQCGAACGAELACGHACGGTCGTCAQGRLHRACTRPCGATNICGHICKEPCKEICPPCTQQCEVKCPHSRCVNLCGEPCVPCKEACARACPHVGACSARCSAACSVRACGEPCARPLPCGHACRGLCAEPCPPACRACRPDQFPVDFLGDAFDDDARFILLQDCGHIMELENMENLMKGDSENVKIRDCPFCRKPIINTYRYKDVINDMFRNNINPIKEKVYGTDKKIKNRRNELENSIKEFRLQLRLSKRTSPILVSFRKLEQTLSDAKKAHLLQLDMLVVYLDILKMVYDCYRKFDETPNKSTTLNVKFESVLSMICTAIRGNIKKISPQMQNDIGNEIKRLNAIVQLSKIINDPAYRSQKSSKIDVLSQKASEQVLTWKKFDESSAFKAFNELTLEVKASVTLIKQERELIVKAIGLKAGHWFKCPNNHFYCIGECGGAMETSKCPECGAKIGGSSHTLLADNALAPEMDGSRYAAWSETANNMANF